MYSQMFCRMSIAEQLKLHNTVTVSYNDKTCGGETVNLMYLYLGAIHRDTLKKGLILTIFGLFFPLMQLNHMAWTRY